MPIDLHTIGVGPKSKSFFSRAQKPLKGRSVITYKNAHAVFIHFKSNLIGGVFDFDVARGQRRTIINISYAAVCLRFEGWLENMISKSLACWKETV